MATCLGHAGTDPVRALIVVLNLCVVAQAVDFAGGTGEPNNPYQIATADQLLGIGNAEYDGKHFVLVADIDMAGVSGGSFLESSMTYGFQGVLDGDFHALRNRTIDAGSAAPELFRKIGGAGVVRNLTLENWDIHVKLGSAGGLLCLANYGRILNCRAINCAINASRTASEVYGGMGILVAANRGVVEDCRADGVTVVCRDFNSFGTGGLVGCNFGVLRRCSAEGGVLGPDRTGGLVGMNSGVIKACRADMTVATVVGESVGGLVGVNQGRIDDCYAIGPIWGDPPSGGLAGEHRGGRIHHCYSTGMVITSSLTGLVVGVGDRLSIDGCYYLSLAGSSAASPLGTPLTLSQMSRRDSYAGWDFIDEDPDHPWLMLEGDYPRLAWEFQRDIPIVAGLSPEDAHAQLEAHGWQMGETRSDHSRSIPPGRVIWTSPGGTAMPGTLIHIVVSRGRFDWPAACTDPNAGTDAQPLQIQTPGQFEALADWRDSERKHFVLAANIDMTGRVLSQPVFGGVCGYFRGTLRGNGCVITNLTIRILGSHTSSLGVGMMASMAESGQITDLVLTHADVTTPDGMGGLLVGSNRGTLRRCRVDGCIIGEGTTGMLVGSNGGLVEQCETRGFAAGETAGGVAGDNYGTIDQCYSDACVWARYGGGGLVGSQAGQLTTSYSRGSVIRGGALMGSASGTTSRCYAAGCVPSENSYGGAAFRLTSDTTAANRIIGCHYYIPHGYDASESIGGLPLFEAQMRHSASFPGWDFWGTPDDGSEDVWLMPADGYPILTWQCDAAILTAVPQVIGLPLDEALFRLGRSAFARHEFDDQVPVSHVARACIRACEEHAPAVELVVSLGPYDWADNEGEGSQVRPFVISLASQLLSLADQPELWDRDFILTADIDLGGIVLDSALIAPDVNSVGYGFQGPSFTGTLDGAGHTIANLTIVSGGDYLGLFGSIQSGRVSHLRTDHVYIQGTAETQGAGPIAGTAVGSSIVDCHTSGWLAGDSGLGSFDGGGGWIGSDCTSAVDFMDIPGPVSGGKR